MSMRSPKPPSTDDVCSGYPALCLPVAIIGQGARESGRLDSVGRYSSLEASLTLSFGQALPYRLNLARSRKTISVLGCWRYNVLGSKPRMFALWMALERADRNG